MPYGITTEAKIKNLYTKLGFNNVFDDLNPVDSRTTIINQFIDDAEQTMLLRLSQCNAEDLVGNAWAESRCTWIAAHYISRRGGNEHYFENLFNEALTELNAIATGEIPLPKTIALADDTIPSMANFVMDERFYREKIRVAPDISVGRAPNQPVTMAPPYYP